MSFHICIINLPAHNEKCDRFLKCFVMFHFVEKSFRKRDAWGHPWVHPITTIPYFASWKAFCIVFHLIFIYVTCVEERTWFIKSTLIKWHYFNCESKQVFSQCTANSQEPEYSCIPQGKVSSRASFFIILFYLLSIFCCLSHRCHDSRQLTDI